MIFRWFFRWTICKDILRVFTVKWLGASSVKPLSKGFIIGHFRVALCLIFEMSPRAKPFNENEFDVHKNGRAGETHCCIYCFTGRLVLTKRLGSLQSIYKQ